MPIPGSVLNGAIPLGTVAAAVAFPSLATLRPITKGIDTTGQETHSFADSVDAEQINLPCRRSPLIQVRPQNQEGVEAQGWQRTEAKYQINFLNFIKVPEVTLLEWQVKVDGYVYQIKSVESDGSGLTTRLMVSDTIPYNA